MINKWKRNIMIEFINEDNLLLKKIHQKNLLKKDKKIINIYLMINIWI